MVCRLPFICGILKPAHLYCACCIRCNVSAFQLYFYKYVAVSYTHIAQVEIERSSDNKIKIHILTAKPGMLIGAKGAEIEKLRAEISKIAGGKDCLLYTSRCV